MTPNLRRTLRRSLALTGLLALSATGITACNDGPNIPKPPAGQVATNPDANTTDVSVTTPVKVVVTHGALLGVNASSPLGPLDGAYSVTPTAETAMPLGKVLPSTWTVKGTLHPETPYTLAVDYVGADGKRRTHTATFTTGAAADLLNPKLSPNNQTVGVGMPIRIELDNGIPKDKRAAFVSRLHVTSNPPVEGAWHWFSSKTLHFRPKEFWPARAEVDVDADLTDFDVGGGVWGSKKVHTHFKIGDSHVSVVSVPNHTMTVVENGKPVKVVPVSTGRDQYPTRSGTHVVSDRKDKIVMDSSAIGIAPGAPGGYRETVKWSVRISDTGEFVHAAPWSTNAQGNANVSHGCVNVSDADGEWFYGYSMIGDVVRVEGSPATLEPTNGLGDWQIPWPQWAN